MDTNRSWDSYKNTPEGRSLVFTYVTHELPIRDTQKKEHILMVSREFSYLYWACAQLGEGKTVQS